MFKTASFADKRYFHYEAMITIIAIHLMALAAPWTFTWEAFTLFAVLYVLIGMFGVTICYHRLLTHKALKVPNWFLYVITFLGCLGLEGGPISWVAAHRLHHKESDTEMDTHSPLVGFWWAHMGWVLYTHPQLKTLEDKKRLVPDLAKDPVIVFFETYHAAIYAIVAFLIVLAGHLLGGSKMALSFLVWGVFVRTIVLWHVTWLVNSATHIWGYQTYKSDDRSRNNWLVALITFGEGWHNNHHFDQRAARNGFEWYEIDFSYGAILVMKMLGLATDIVEPSRAAKSPGLVNRKAPNKGLPV